MSDHKDYISRCEEMGNIHISEEVIAAIAAASVLEVPGVVGLSANFGTDLSELLGKKSLTKGVHVQVEETTLVISLTVMMAYGHTIPEICKAIQEGVQSAVEAMSGLSVTAVNVTVGGITFPQNDK